MIAIRPLACVDSRQVASLHLECLQSNFSGRPGLELLSLYYKALVSSAGACGFVAEREGRLLGYVCGVWGPVSVRRALFKESLFPLVFYALWQVISQPALLASLLNRADRAHSPQELSGYELRPIVVSPVARGSGAAGLLVRRLAEDAAQRGYRQIHLVTETDNIAAQKFYQKTGFQLDSTIHRSGRPYFQYIMRLDPLE